MLPTNLLLYFRILLLFCSVKIFICKEFNSLFFSNTEIFVCVTVCERTSLDSDNDENETTQHKLVWRGLSVVVFLLLFNSIAGKRMHLYVTQFECIAHTSYDLGLVEVRRQYKYKLLPQMKRFSLASLSTIVSFVHVCIWQAMD